MKSRGLCNEMELANERNCCFFTGHRRLSVHAAVRAARLTGLLCEKLIKKHGVTDFITGGALGYDLIAAREVLRLRQKYPVRLHMYLPCTDQTELWRKDQQEEWRSIAAEADSVRYITDGPYINGCMQKRNRAMVDSAYFGIAFCLKSRGGTAGTLRYAQKRGRRVAVLTEPGSGAESIGAETVYI